MSASTPNPLVALFGDSGLTISKDDVVAIAVARKEEELKAELAAALKSITKCDETAVALSKEHQKASSEFSKAEAKVYVDSFTVFMKNLGVVDPEFTDTVTTSQHGEDTFFNITVQSSSTYRRRDEERNGSISFTFRVPCPQTVLDIKAKTNSNIREKEQLQSRCVDVKRELASLSSLERKARAAIAIDTLKTTEAGRSVLKTLSVVADKPLMLDFGQ